jgi:hypothetical protein
VVPSDSEEDDDERLVLQNSTQYFTALPEPTTPRMGPPPSRSFPNYFFFPFWLSVWTQAMQQHQTRGELVRGCHNNRWRARRDTTSSAPRRRTRRRGGATMKRHREAEGRALPVAPFRLLKGAMPTTSRTTNEWTVRRPTQTVTRKSVRNAAPSIPTGLYTLHLPHSLRTHSTGRAYEARCAIAQGNLHIAVAAGSLGRQEKGGEEDSAEGKEDRQPVRTQTSLRNVDLQSD